MSKNAKIKDIAALISMLGPLFMVVGAFLFLHDNNELSLEETKPQIGLGSIVLGISLELLAICICIGTNILEQIDISNYFDHHILNSPVALAGNMDENDVQVDV